MIDRSRYKQQTIVLYEYLLEISKNLNASSIKEEEKKFMIGRVKSFKHNWDKHIQAKQIEGSTIDNEVNKILQDIKYLITPKNEELKLDGLKLLEIYKDIEEFILELDALIKDDIFKLTEILNGLCDRIAKTITMHDIDLIAEKQHKDNLVEILLRDCKSNAFALQNKYNRVVDAMEILEELKL